MTDARYWFSCGSMLSAGFLTLLVVCLAKVQEKIIRATLELLVKQREDIDTLRADVDRLEKRLWEASDDSEEPEDHVDEYEVERN